MRSCKEGIIVGVLGQWASGKSSASAVLLKHLGGESAAIFLSDRETFARQVVNYFLELEDSQVTTSFEEDGRRRLDAQYGSVWLNPGEDLRTVDLHTLYFYIIDKVISAWLNQARVELGHYICERSAEGKPIVIEAGFGKNPIDHTISDLFLRLEQAGVKCGQAKWIIIEAGFETRSVRNAHRRDFVPVDLFARYAADGGDLNPDQQKRLEEKGVTITRVPNNHNDFKKFSADIISAFDEMFGGVL